MVSHYKHFMSKIAAWPWCFRWFPLDERNSRGKWAESECSEIVFFIYHYAHFAFSPVAQDQTSREFHHAGWTGVSFHPLVTTVKCDSQKLSLVPDSSVCSSWVLLCFWWLLKCAEFFLGVPVCLPQQTRAPPKDCALVLQFPHSSLCACALAAVAQICES